jgi:HSP20 family protein
VRNTIQPLREVRRMAGLKELIKTEKPRYMAPFEEMERWFENVLRRPYSLASHIWPDMKLGEFETVAPHVDIFEEGNELVFKADVPGLEKKDIDVQISENFLTISGCREKEEKVERENYYSYERFHGSFFRRFELPYDVDAEKIKAHLDKGVLEVRVPKSEEAKKKTRKISIA